MLSNFCCCWKGTGTLMWGEPCGAETSAAGLRLPSLMFYALQSSGADTRRSTEGKHMQCRSVA